MVHEWLHAIVYPKDAIVTIGRMKGKLTFVALVSYPLKRNRFVLMCIFPFLLGIIPLVIFIISPASLIVLNGLMFGMACMGMFANGYRILELGCGNGNQWEGHIDKLPAFCTLILSDFSEGMVNVVWEKYSCNKNVLS